MIEKLLSKLNLSESEEKLIKKVFQISTIVFAVLLSTALILNFFNYKKITAREAKKKNREKIITESLTLKTYYRQNSKDILPIDIEAHESAAEHYKNISPDKEIKHLLRIVAAKPDSIKVKCILADAFIRAGFYFDAKQLLDTLLLKPKGIEDSVLSSMKAEYGLMLFYNGEIKKSLDYLSGLVKKDSVTSYKTKCYLAQVKASFNRNDPTIKALFEAAIKSKIDYTEGYYQYARYLMDKPNSSPDDYKKARLLLKKAINISPLVPKLYARLGIVYYYLRLYGLAEKAYLTSLKLNPQDYNTHYNLGELYFSALNDVNKALNEFKKAVELDSTHTMANFKIGLILMSNNQVKEAARYFITANRSDPKNIRIQFQLAVAYEKIGRIDDAIKTYQNILKIDNLNDIALHKLKLLQS